MTFGEASLERTQKEYVKKNYFSFTKDRRSFVVRILPPFGSLKNDPLGWAKYWEVHFGYTDTKGKMRPFASSLRKGKNGQIFRPDPAVERIESLRAKLASANTPEEREEIEGQLRRFNVSKRWYLNVVDLEGNIGLLSIPHKMMLSLQTELRALEAEGHKPLSFEKGLFLEFTKEGVGRDTVHKVSRYLETTTINGKKYKAEKTHEIDDAFAARAEKECFDLGELYIQPTPEEIAAIVNGGPEALEAVFDAHRSKTNTSHSSSPGTGVTNLEEITQAKAILNSNESVIDYDSMLNEAIGE